MTDGAAVDDPKRSVLEGSGPMPLDLALAVRALAVDRALRTRPDGPSRSAVFATWATRAAAGAAQAATHATGPACHHGHQPPPMAAAPISPPSTARNVSPAQAASVARHRSNRPTEGSTAWRSSARTPACHHAHTAAGTASGPEATTAATVATRATPTSTASPASVVCWVLRRSLKSLMAQKMPRAAAKSRRSSGR